MYTSLYCNPSSRFQITQILFQTKILENIKLSTFECVRTINIIILKLQNSTSNESDWCLTSLIENDYIIIVFAIN